MSPIAFMIMPYGVRDTGGVGPGVPPRIDYDALWERAYLPALRQLGYRAMRADADIGAMILPEMIRRLVHADLVIADISIPNANVYYETGLRHAAQRDGCVLIAASWAKPVFDLAQVRHLRFSLPDGDIPDQVALAIRTELMTGLPTARDGVSPVYEAVPGYPTTPASDTAFTDILADVAQFDAEVAGVRGAPEDERRPRAAALLRTYGARPAIRDLEVLTIVRLLYEIGAWAELLEYVPTLPPRLARLPLIAEYTALAIGKSGDPAQAAGQLSALIQRAGPTSERLGLLGGRYKQLYYRAVESGDQFAARHHLRQAISSYEAGMYCDLNDYYPTSNLPALYRIRNQSGDAEQAVQTAAVALVALRRARQRNPSDEWLLPTSLRMAVHHGDADEAARLLMQVIDAGLSMWKLASTLSDLQSDVMQTVDPVLRRELQVMLDQLRPLVTTARVHTTADVGGALHRLQIHTGRPVLVSVGGAAGLTDDRGTQLAQLFDRTFALIDELGGAVVDGGTAAGIMRALGTARQAGRRSSPLIGVAAIGTVARPGVDVTDDRARLDPNHTHTVLVPGSAWGDEATWIAAVAGEIAGAAPSATLLTNGGEVAYRDVAASLDAGRPVVVLAGTGRTADAIADARAGRPAPAEAERVAGSPLVRIVDHTDAAAVLAVLRALLS